MTAHDVWGVPVIVSDVLTGPSPILVGGNLILPATRPTLRLPLLEHYARVPIPGRPDLPPITPWWFDPAKWPDREPSGLLEALRGAL